VEGHAAGALGRASRAVAGVDQAQLVLVVADAELEVGGRLAAADRVLGLDAQELAIPGLGGLHVGGPALARCILDMHTA
jgi:hypothetical protein